MAIPKIDPNVTHVTVGQFRRVAQSDLPQRTFVVNDGNTPVAVCVPYDTFMEMQRAVECAPPMLASLPQGGPVAGSSARGFDPSLGQRVPGTPGPAPDSPLRGV